MKTLSASLMQWESAPGRHAWPGGEVIRAPVFDTVRLQQHAVSLAESHRVSGAGISYRHVKAALVRNQERLAAAREALMAAVRNGETITPGGEWLVDNFHTISQHTQQAIADLPSGFYRQLPKIQEGHLAQQPRVMAIAWAYLAHTDSQVSERQLADFINAYQTVSPLTIGELWALPIHLRILLIENAARIALRTVQSQRARTAAAAMAERIAGETVDNASIRADFQHRPGHAQLSYLVELERRLHGKRSLDLQDLIGADSDLRGELRDPSAAAHGEQSKQVANNLSMQNIFTSLKAVGEMDWEAWFQSVSAVDAILSRTPVYLKLDKQSRTLYRRAVEDLARQSGESETGIAEKAVAIAGHDDVGAILIGSARRRFEDSVGYRPSWPRRLGQLTKAVGLPGYIVAALLLASAIIGIGVGALSAAAPGMAVILILIALSLPLAFDAALAMVNYAVTQLMRPMVLPALDFEHGIPAEHRTVIAVPVLLSSFHGVEAMLDRIEGHYLTNDDANLYYAIVSDWSDAGTELLPDDRPLLQRLEHGIAELNRKHGHERFLVFHRGRRWNESQGVWMGWERKRGKLHELNRLLRGATDTSFIAVPPRLPGNVRYIIVLDADTLLPRGAAARLVGKIAHPLNAPVFDRDKHRVTSGYGILQPRVATLLPERGEGSVYFNLSAGRAGIDPYVFASSDLYQDLFGEGTFTGKGLYDIDAFEASVEGRVPENALLSHDLFEGNFARAALVSDVEVAEDFPDRLVVDLARHHRWTRGDWQLLPWMFPPASGLTGLGWWKMFDNLRRSLTPIFVVATLVAGWALLPTFTAATWTVMVLAVMFVPSLLPIFSGSSMRREPITLASEVRSFLDDLLQAMRLTAARLTFAVQQAAVMIDAIVRTIYRLAVSRRKLLEWTAAAQLQSSLKPTLGGTYRLMWPSVLVGGLLIVLAIVLGGAWRVAGLPFGALWLAAPALAYFISLPREAAIGEGASARERSELRLIALRTWRYFDEHVVAGDNMLPPDNLQEDPAPVVAHRTSPTNIGLYLLSVVSAHDMGWIGLDDAVRRLQATLDTVGQMKRVRGHLLNWYDTRTLSPLAPQYISTVDSGNFATHLIAIANACEAWKLTSPPRPERLDGLADMAGMVRAIVQDTRRSHRVAASAAARAETEIEAITQTLHDLQRQPGIIAVRMVTLIVRISQLRQSLRLMWEAVDYAGRGDGLYWADRLMSASESFLADAMRDHAGQVRLIAQLQSIAAACRSLAYGADFGFLLNRKRGLLSIGFRVEDESLDDSCYDMLASEAALTNYLAIAKSDVTGKLWARLGRPIVAVDNRACLLSWSGSMFEYLMPLLVLHAPEGTLYRQTMSLAVRRQQTYASAQGVPWGISESAYAGRDRHLTYQYSSFGVPGLGLKRGLADELVVAPYATGLAAMIAPSEAARNYQRLDALGALGRFGFIESIDYTASRLRPNEQFELVRAYFAHHQGMTITAIHNAVCDGALRRYFHRENNIRAAELLLQERAPTYLPTNTTVMGPEPGPKRGDVSGELAARLVEPRQDCTPRVNILSNARVSLMLTADGRGYTRWNNIAISRWREDPVRGEGGVVIALRDRATGTTWPAVAWDTGENPPELTVFSQEKTEFKRTDHDIACHVECLVSSEQDVELRLIELVNMSGDIRSLDITTYLELALAQQDADESHPAFSKLFVQTEFDPEYQALLATRRRRLDGDPDIWVAQFLVSDDPRPSSVSVETSRDTFRGRGDDLRSSPGFATSGTLSGKTGDVLDPVFAFRQVVELVPHRKRRIALWTAMADSREAVLSIVANHRLPAALDRVRVNAWTQSRVLLRHLSMDVEEANQLQDLASSIVYSRPVRRPSPSAIVEGMRPQPTLWGLSISGVRPIVAIKISTDGGMAFVDRMLKAQDYWFEKGLVTDVVIINTNPVSYAQDLHTALERLVSRERMRKSASELAGGDIFLVRSDSAGNDTVGAVLAAAHVVLESSSGTLDPQSAAPVVPRRTSPSAALPAVPAAVVDPARIDGLLFFNGFGGFDSGSNEYVIVHRRDRRLPAPWINVIANERFGTHCSAEGGGYTWVGNSKEQQITCWSNDPLIDRPSEMFFIHDATGRLLYSPTVDPLGPRAGAFVTRHGLGYTVHEASEGDLDMELAITVDVAEPVKRNRLRLTNRSPRPRRLLVTFYAEVALAKSRRAGAHVVTSAWDGDAGILLLRNRWNTDFRDTVVFADMGPRTLSWSADRASVLGVGPLSCPPPVANGLVLGKQAGGGLDPCIALQAEITLAAGESDEIVVSLGTSSSDEQARDTARRLRTVSFDDTLNAQRGQWADVTGTVTVSTPDPAFDLMMNGWLLYQALSCRFWGRAGFYQSSGAFGFRDQLQDSMAIAHVRPDLARRHILRAAARQFREGDVQHWWLPGTGAGVRTHISDDTSWLAYCTAHYVRLTGDQAVLDEIIPFLDGPDLPREVHDKFFIPDVSDEQATLYEHCARGLDRAVVTGPHGLPLMGTGDWNDGMNKVGEQGRGESIWLGWLVCATLEKFAEIARSRGDTERQSAWTRHRALIAKALDRHGWDGEWYRRAYFDDQTPLGTAASDECRIDTIAQSWAVMSGAADPVKARTALASADDLLVDTDAGIAHLFQPPLRQHQPNAGYIQSYPPGIRENGGQYTHGALWAIYAHAELGHGDKAHGLFALINPINHAQDEAAAARYRVEPYVIAADVYSHADYRGRGGWTWYTGAAAWAYRAGLEAILGMRRDGHLVHVKPCLPGAWPSCEVSYRYEGKRITIRITRGTMSGQAMTVVDLRSCADGAVIEHVIAS